jgi:tetratricopeptide (TPR) repeat protein
MATGRGALLVLGLLLGCAAPAQAGLYSSAEPFDNTLSPDFRRFRETLITLRNLGNPQSQMANRYLFQVSGPLARGLPDNLPVGERIDLGAALVRLRKYEEAVRVLQRGDAQDRGNYLLLANLATAYYLAGQERRAVEAVTDARLSWPTDWGKLSKEKQAMLHQQLGWDEKQFAWYRKAETYFQKLLRLRLRESQRQQAKGTGPADDLDDLFDSGGTSPRPVRFVGEGGKYEAGKIAAAERDKLPGDALLIVEQLLVWMPNDLRLYWLLGELYNAQGDVTSALAIFDDLVAKGSRFPELREHRRILQAHPRTSAAPVADTGPGPAPPPPAGGDKKGDSELPGWSPSPWQTLGVGFLAGLLVALLGVWQVREIVRRRTLAAKP